MAKRIGKKDATAKAESGPKTQPDGSSIPEGMTWNKKLGKLVRVPKKHRASKEEIKALGNAGLLIAVSRVAIALGQGNGFSGSLLANYKPSSINGFKDQLLNTKSGKIVKASNETVDGLITEARGIKSELKGNEYTPAVAAFLDSLQNTFFSGSGGGFGGKKITGAYLDDFTDF